LQTRKANSPASTKTFKHIVKNKAWTQCAQSASCILEETRDKTVDDQSTPRLHQQCARAKRYNNSRPAARQAWTIAMNYRVGWPTRAAAGYALGLLVVEHDPQLGCRSGTVLTNNDQLQAMEGNTFVYARWRVIKNVAPRLRILSSGRSHCSKPSDEF
jgi:hypothetical protein